MTDASQNGRRKRGRPKTEASSRRVKVSVSLDPKVIESGTAAARHYHMPFSRLLELLLVQHLSIAQPKDE